MDSVHDSCDVLHCISQCIFLNGNVLIPIKISLKFVCKGAINNIPALVQTVAWNRPGDKSLSEPAVASLPTYRCVTRPQWLIYALACLLWFGIGQMSPYLTITSHEGHGASDNRWLDCFSTAYSGWYILFTCHLWAISTHNWWIAIHGQ